jgi:hypothetical protein
MSKSKKIPNENDVGLLTTGVGSISGLGVSTVNAIPPMPSKKKFLRDRDDSSSEDEEKEVRTNWRSKIAQKRVSLAADSTLTGAIKSDFKFSFLAHEFGKLVLSSSEVRERYNALKPQLSETEARNILKRSYKSASGDIRTQAKGSFDSARPAVIDALLNDDKTFSVLRNLYKTISQKEREKYYVEKRGDQFNGAEWENAIKRIKEEFNAHIEIFIMNNSDLKTKYPNSTRKFLTEWVDAIATERDSIRAIMDHSIDIANNEIIGIELLSRVRQYNKNALRATRNDQAVDASKLGIDFMGAGANTYMKSLPGSINNVGIFERKIGTTGVKEIEWINNGKTRSSSVHYSYSTKNYNALFSSLRRDNGVNDIETIRKVLSGETSFDSAYEALPTVRLKTSFTEVIYLLSVTEVMKNPAGAVIHPMMLELIEGGKIEKSNLAPDNSQARQMPVAIKDAISAGRGIDIGLYSK